MVKALPHVGKAHGETVCCAGVTADGEWRRLFPVPFRRLDSKFKRWNWIEFQWRTALPKDRRPESRRVQEDSIQIVGTLGASARSRLLSSVIVPSIDEAVSRNQTLALIRPANVRFDAVKKSSEAIAREKRAYAAAAAQASFLDDELKAMEPCPFAFHFHYDSSDGKSHSATSDDWETAAMFYNFKRNYGEGEALKKMKQTFEVTYPEKGMAFAMGTHSRYPKTWLLVGIIRIDEEMQKSLF
ncbi:MAG: hypothetical protein U0942_03005 [Parvibaculum sp.]|uniref:hypothetical protein n=1 Tax=Parvibaculum sp. TaxID=2024848 RepID=UPI002ABAFF0E|nr:hypothetical protein [Parvibaculum sp.]MDZ4380289.1 hypothetical protein [Parvibaculum sp.]